jgi:hypothetical protein
MSHMTVKTRTDHRDTCSDVISPLVSPPRLQKVTCFPLFLPNVRFAIGDYPFSNMTTMAPWQMGFGSEISPIFHWPVYFCSGLTAVCYILSVITGNVSQVS